MDNWGSLAFGDIVLTRHMYLHGAAQAEDAVVGFLGLQTLERSGNDVVLLGEQVIGPVR